MTLHGICCFLSSVVFCYMASFKDFWSKDAQSHGARSSGTARQVGYNVSDDYSAGYGYEFVPIGQVIRNTDEVYMMGRWHELKSYPTLFYYIGLCASTHFYPPRRRSLTFDGVARWSCGHGRDADATSCIVCQVIHFRHVDK